MKVLIVKNITREGPGLLEGILRSYKIGFDIVDLDKGERFPDPTPYVAVFVFGGPDSANDSTPKMREELKRIKEIIDAKIPYLGACLGMQTLVKACGGDVEMNRFQGAPFKEIGWKDPKGESFEVILNSDGKIDPLFEGMPPKLKIFHLHGETVKLGREMTLLGEGFYCKNQVVKVGKSAYGIQGHFELTEKMFEQWVANDPDLMPLDKAALKRDYESEREEYEMLGRKIFTNFLKIAKII